MIKLCTHCKKELSIHHFWKDARTKSGYSPWCKDCIRSYKRIWNAENKEHNNKKHREARLKYPDKFAYKAILVNASRRNISVVISKESFYEWFNTNPHVCVYCGMDEPTSKKEFNKRITVDRKNNHVGYVLENIVFACERCNLLKKDFFTYEEWLEIAEKYIKPKLRDKKFDRV